MWGPMGANAVPAQSLPSHVPCTMYCPVHHIQCPTLYVCVYLLHCRTVAGPVLLCRVGSVSVLTVGAVPLLTSTQCTHLPNPAVDLHWCDCKGAITDVFLQNACYTQITHALSKYMPKHERKVHTCNTIHCGSNARACKTLPGARIASMGVDCES